MYKDPVPSSQKNSLQALKGQTANAVWGNNWYLRRESMTSRERENSEI